MLRWNSVGFFRKGAHEFNAAARDDEIREARSTQKAQHFQHRLIDQRSIGAVPFRMPRSLQPFGGDALEFLGRIAGHGSAAQTH